MAMGPQKKTGWRPAAHFALIGSLLFLGDRWLAGGAPGGRDTALRPPITVSAARVDQLGASFRRRAGAAPTPAQLEALIADEVDGEILYREALARGLDRHDRGVRARLIQKMRFLASDPARDPQELYREALALGLDRQDLVVRRILVEKMRLVLKHAGVVEGAPDDAALLAYLGRHRERFTQDARVSLSHVFLSADRRGARVEGDARRLLAELEAGSEAGELGEPFPVDQRLGARTRREIESLFGAPFARQILTLEPGSWRGPLRSAYGLHLVQVHEKVPARAAPLAAVRNRVLHAVVAERREQRFEQGLRRLRELYEIRVEDLAPVAGERS